LSSEKIGRHHASHTNKGGKNVKILHILNDGPTELSTKIIGVQSKDHEVKVVDLSKKEMSYEAIIDAIVSSDKVISW
jgi:hypothetical protein